MVPGVPAPKIVKRPFESARTLELLRRTAGEDQAGYRGVLAPIAAAPDLYTPLLDELPLGRVAIVAAKTGGVGLARTGIGWKAALAGLTLIAMSFGLPALWLSRSDAPWFAWLIALPFVLLALLAVFAGLQRLVSRLRQVSVDLDQSVVFLGDEVVARVSTPASLSDFQVRLTCVEAARVVERGDWTVRTRVRWSAMMHLVERATRGGTTVSTLNLRLPLEGPASFEDEECSLRWCVTIATTSGWLDETFRFHAVPRVRS